MGFRTHPIADAWAPGLLVYEARHRYVVLSASIRALVDWAVEKNAEPALITPVTSVLSWAVAEALRSVNGRWAVRTLDGRLFSAHTGFQIREVADLWDEPDLSAEQLDTFTGAPANDDAYLMVDVYARERAMERTRLGGIASAMVEGIGTGAMHAWGLQEPLPRPWDVDELTASIRSQMPSSDVHYASGDDGSMFRVTAARTTTGLLEHTKGLVPVGDHREIMEHGGATHLARQTRVEATLTRIAEEFRPTIAIMSLTQGIRVGQGPGQWVSARWPDQPVAVLIGPWAVRDLDLDLSTMSYQHDLTYVGSRRAPSVLLRMSGPDPAWHQFLAFAYDLDQERLAIATGALEDQSRKDA